MLSSHMIQSNNAGFNEQEKDNRSNVHNNNEQPGSRSAGGVNSTNESTGTSNLQAEILPGIYGRTIQHITCYNCRKRGHYADNCPKMTDGHVGEE